MCWVIMIARSCAHYQLRWWLQLQYTLEKYSNSEFEFLILEKSHTFLFLLLQEQNLTSFHKTI